MNTATLKAKNHDPLNRSIEEGAAPDGREMSVGWSRSVTGNVMGGVSGGTKLCSAEGAERRTRCNGEMRCDIAENLL